MDRHIDSVVAGDIGRACFRGSTAWDAEHTLMLRTNVFVLLMNQPRAQANWCCTSLNNGDQHYGHLARTECYRNRKKPRFLTHQKKECKAIPLKQQRVLPHQAICDGVVAYE